MTSNEWGAERYGLGHNDAVFDAVAAVTPAIATRMTQVRATTGVFFFTVDQTDLDPAYTQHLQDFYWEHSERELLQRAVNVLAASVHGPNGIDVDIVDDAAALDTLVASFDIPAPPTGQWLATLIIVYTPHPLTKINVLVTFVKNPEHPGTSRPVIVQALAQLLNLYDRAP